MKHPWTRVLVCGGRDYGDRRRVSEVMCRLYARGTEVLIHGAARGADALAAEIWQHLSGDDPSRRTIAFPADWARDGKRAGPLRNQRMIDEGRPDVVIAFPGSRGTSDCIARAKRAGIPVYRINGG